MARTTVDIDTPLLNDLREIAARENKPLRKVIGDVLAVGLQARKTDKKPRIPRLKWHSQPMKPRIDYLDKDALYQVLDLDGSK